MGAGSLREAGEERAGDGIPKGAGDGIPKGAGDGIPKEGGETGYPRGQETGYPRGRETGYPRGRDQGGIGNKFCNNRKSTLRREPLRKGAGTGRSGRIQLLHLSWSYRQCFCEIRSFHIVFNHRISTRGQK